MDSFTEDPNASTSGSLELPLLLHSDDDYGASSTQSSPFADSHTHTSRGQLSPISRPTPPSSTEVMKPQGTRKGHKKSRAGCFQCKRRKIKCQETLPACVNCLRRDLECKYPERKSFEVYEMSVVRGRRWIQTPQPSAPLQSTPTQFTMDDMRLFQHFILKAYPHLPINNDDVWVYTVPAFSHNYEYLMHAMLGLAATHLTVVSNIDYRKSANKYRLLAMKGFQEALSKDPGKGADSDALLAAIYALTFQASYMEDSLVEFLTMVRGCVVLSDYLENKNSIAFFDVSFDWWLAYMQPRLTNLSPIDPALVGGAEKSLGTLNFVSNDQVNSFFYNQLSAAVDGIRISPKLGYWGLMAIYTVIGRLDDNSFTAFLSPSNTIGPVLLAHFLALELILLPPIAQEWEKLLPRSQLGVRFNWIDAIKKTAAPELQAFIKWPSEIFEKARIEWGTTLTVFNFALPEI